MIHINNINISGVYSGLIDISAVYKGLLLVWSKLNNYNYWSDEYPWDDNLYWCELSNTIPDYYNNYYVDEYSWNDNCCWGD